MNLNPSTSIGYHPLLHKPALRACHEDGEASGIAISIGMKTKRRGFLPARSTTARSHSKTPQLPKNMADPPPGCSTRAHSHGEGVVTHRDLSRFEHRPAIIMHHVRVKIPHCLDCDR